MINSLVALLMHSRNQAHIFHLQTNSFAAHTALQKYYEGIVPLVDTLAETYQGKYEIMTDIKISQSLPYQSGTQNYITYFKSILDFMESNAEKFPQDSELKNIYDEIKSLLSSTLYLLKSLK